MKSSQLKRTRREERIRNRQLSPKRLKAIGIVCGIILLMAGGMFSVDLLRAKHKGLPPIFCIPVIEYGNGSVDYYGLFYKVWKDYDPFEDETRYYLGFWLIPKNFNI